MFSGMVGSPPVAQKSKTQLLKSDAGVTEAHAASASWRVTPVPTHAAAGSDGHGRSDNTSGAQSGDTDWPVKAIISLLARSFATKRAHCEREESKPQRVWAPFSSKSIAAHERCVSSVHHVVHFVATVSAVVPGSIRSGAVSEYQCDSQVDDVRLHVLPGEHTEPARPSTALADDSVISAASSQYKYGTNWAVKHPHALEKLMRGLRKL